MYSGCYSSQAISLHGVKKEQEQRAKSLAGWCHGGEGGGPDASVAPHARAEEQRCC